MVQGDLQSLREEVMRKKASRSHGQKFINEYVEQVKADQEKLKHTVAELQGQLDAHSLLLSSILESMGCMVQEMKVLKEEVERWECKEQECHEMTSPMIGCQPSQVPTAQSHMGPETSLGTWSPTIAMPPGFASTTHGEIGTGIGYSPIVQNALNVDQTRQHVHQSNPLVTGQEEIQPEMSTHDVSFGEMLRPERHYFRTERTFPTTSSSLH